MPCTYEYRFCLGCQHHVDSIRFAMRISSAPVLFGIAGSALASGVAVREASSLDLEKCPGYAASNVREEGGKLSAELSLAGTPCDAFGEDLKDLKLEVEYQTGELF